MIVVLAAGLLAAAAQGQAPVDAGGKQLGACLVRNTTAADRLTVARWFAGVIASTPPARDVATLLPERKPAADRAMAALFTRLLVKDSATEARPLFAAGDGAASIEAAGEALGEIAFAELLRSPEAKAALEAYTGYFKADDFAPLVP